METMFVGVASAKAEMVGGVKSPQGLMELAIG
jgi:hypothetical protein